MSDSTTPERLTELVRDFMSGLRSHVVSSTDGDAEEAIERVFGVLAAVGAGILMAIPSAKRGERMITALLAIAMRFFTKRGAEDART